ncbi:MAG: IPExxxVDY family protein [Crocinitomicaceae bacterium]|nr:IPExxxVDY family protein [Crocinitomicaceae bacterium]
MKTFILNIDYSDQFDFELIGLRSSEKDFKLAWAMNIHFRWDMSKGNDVRLESDNDEILFSRFDYENSDYQYTISLVENRSSGGWMLPEWTQFDYLLKVDNGQWMTNDDFYRRLREIPSILAAFPLALDKLKSKHNLIFWEYAPSGKSRDEKNQNSCNHRPGIIF